MLQNIENLLKRLVSALAILDVIALVAMMTLTFVDVTGRTLFGRALTGTVESVTLLMGVLVFSGLAYTEFKQKHVVVDVLQNLFSAPLKKFSSLLNLGIATFITAIMTWRLTASANSIFVEGETTMIWSLPYWPVAIIMVVGMSLFFLVLALKLLQSIHSLRSG
jgi:TRAP-type C4-dicarboxylate transport system permease small subunit